MALSINDQPSDRFSINNELLFIVYEATKANDEVTYPDYSYVCDVYVESTFAGRIIARPDPTNKMGIFDISSILRSYMTYGLKANYTNFTEEYVIKLNYTLQFGEQYDGVLYPNLLSNGPREVYRSYEIKPFRDDTTGSDVMTDVDGKFASSMPDIFYACRDAKWQLLPFWDNVSGLTNFECDFYDINGNVILSTGTPITYTAKSIIQFNVSLVHMAAVSSLSAAQKNAVEKIIITYNGNVKTIILKCSRYPSQTIAWLNKYGGYDSYCFGLVSKKMTEITRKEFQQLNYRISAGGEISYSADGVYYGGRRGFATDMKTTLKLTSHLLNDAEYQWLSEMFHSPEVYIFNADRDKFMPVSIQENNYEFRTYLNSRLKPLEFNVIFSDNYNAQYL